jgi:hypothetical protein
MRSTKPSLPTKEHVIVFTLSYVASAYASCLAGMSSRSTECGHSRGGIALIWRYPIRSAMRRTRLLQGMP